MVQVTSGIGFQKEYVHNLFLCLFVCLNTMPTNNDIMCLFQEIMSIFQMDLLLETDRFDDLTENCMFLSTTGFHDGVAGAVKSRQTKSGQSLSGGIDDTIASDDYASEFADASANILSKPKHQHVDPAADVDEIVSSY
jgi:hypothetical protein